MKKWPTKQLFIPTHSVYDGPCEYGVSPLLENATAATLQAPYCVPIALIVYIRITAIAVIGDIETCLECLDGIHRKMDKLKRQHMGHSQYGTLINSNASVLDASHILSCSHG